MVLSEDDSRPPNDMRAPMTEVLDSLAQKLALLKEYEARFGPLDTSNGNGVAGAGGVQLQSSASASVPTVRAPVPHRPIKLTNGVLAANENGTVTRPVEVEEPEQEEDEEEEEEDVEEVVVSPGSESVSSRLETPESGSYV
jgi:hypothetical protein